MRLGGLHVVGTERHESRRIDNQVRACARQAWPGWGESGCCGRSAYLLWQRRAGLALAGRQAPRLPPARPQLRGRSGRQGDPGSTRFFLSLEDNLFRIFGGDRCGGCRVLLRLERRRAAPRQARGSAAVGVVGGVGSQGVGARLI